MKKVLLLLLMIFILFSCENKKEEIIYEEVDVMKEINLYIDDELIDIIWEDNESIKELKKQLENNDISIEMSIYGGFEQVGPLGFSLPRNDKQINTTAGDIVLYSGNQIVIFFGSNSWSYTKLGRISNKSQEELNDLLGNKDVQIRLTLK